jgi:hypothetical protein
VDSVRVVYVDESRAARRVSLLLSGSGSPGRPEKYKRGTSPVTFRVPKHVGEECRGRYKRRGVNFTELFQYLYLDLAQKSREELEAMLDAFREKYGPVDDVEVPVEEA